MGGNTVSVAGLEQASSIAAIYNPYVETTAITFESEPINERAVADWIRELTERYPWFVVERDGQTVGYAYASPLRTQAAYRWTVELSVYVERECRGEGVGSQLYERSCGRSNDRDSKSRTALLGSRTPKASTFTNDSISNGSVYFRTWDTNSASGTMLRGTSDRSATGRRSRRIRSPSRRVVPSGGFPRFSSQRPVVIAPANVSSILSRSTPTSFCPSVR